MDAKVILNQAGHLVDLAKGQMKKELSDLPALRQKDFQILEYIWRSNPEHSVKMADLTQFMGVSPAATSQLINSYEGMEIAQRVRSTEDRRANFVQIHPELLRKVGEKADRLEKQCQQFLDGLSEEEQETLVRIMDTLVSTLEDAADSR